MILSHVLTPEILDHPDYAYHPRAQILSQNGKAARKGRRSEF